MPSTHLSLHYHLIFSTKNREPIIQNDWRARLHEYLGGTSKDLKGYSQIVGGVNDHVHLLVALKATHCLSDFMRDRKRSSSIWVRDNIGTRDFAWQEGYAAFTVSATARDRVYKYIASQEEHHRKETFREELVKLLDMAGVVYDERYLD